MTPQTADRFSCCCACLIFVIAAGAACSRPDSSGPGDAAPTITSGAINACALFTEAEIAEIVGNPVLKGRHEAGSTTCKWDPQNQGDVDVLLITGAPGSDREKYICPELRKTPSTDPAFTGVGDVVTWKFSSAGTLFNSGDLEACGRKGFISLSLNGKRDEATLKQASAAIARRIFDRP